MTWRTLSEYLCMLVSQTRSLAWLWVCRRRLRSANFTPKNNLPPFVMTVEMGPPGSKWSVNPLAPCVNCPFPKRTSPIRDIWTAPPYFFHQESLVGEAVKLKSSVKSHRSRVVGSLVGLLPPVAYCRSMLYFSHVFPQFSSVMSLLSHSSWDYFPKLCTFASRSPLHLEYLVVPL